MNWDDFRYILVLSRTKTLSGAATALGVTRTTVGRRIGAIESSLGVRLFDRTPEGFVPTSSGQELSDVAAQFEPEALAAEGRALGRDAKLTGKLRVSTVDFILGQFIDVFSSFIERYPGIELTVSTTYDEVSLRRREADVALRINNAPSNYLVGRRLGQVEFGLYASHALLERVGHDAALNEFPWLRIDERIEDEATRRWLDQNAPGAQTAMRCASIESLHTSLIAGIGVHFFPCLVGDADPGLVQIRQSIPEFSRALWALSLPALITNSRVRAFMDHFYERLGARLT